MHSTTKGILQAPLVLGRPKLELDRVEEASGYQIHSNTELEGCRKVKSEVFENGGAKIVFLPKTDVFCKILLLAPLVMERPKLELDHVAKASGYQIHSNMELEGCWKVKSEVFKIGDAKIVFLPKIVVFCKIVLLAPLVLWRPKLELDHAEEVLNTLRLSCCFALVNDTCVRFSFNKDIFCFSFFIWT